MGWTSYVTPLPASWQSTWVQRQTRVCFCPCRIYSQLRDYALDNGSRIAAMHVSILRRQLESLREVKEDAFEALTAISEIEDKVSGGDWDEIEQARDIANAALSAYKASVVVLPENQSPC